MADPTMIMKDLYGTYQPLIGARFTATHQGIWEMPQTGNDRDRLEIAAGTPFAATLHQISKAVLTKYGAMVWKGVTGPEDSIRYTEYWLWVEPGFGGNLLEGSTYEFSIVKADVFQCVTGEFSYGVSLKAVVHLV